MARALFLAVLAIVIGTAHAGANALDDAFEAYDAQDYQDAFRRFSALGEQGDADGQYLLGLAYQKGFGGLSVDPEEARRLFALSAAQGNERAQRQLDGM